MSLTDHTGTMFLSLCMGSLPTWVSQTQTHKAHCTPTHATANTDQEEEKEDQGRETAGLIKAAV